MFLWDLDVGLGVDGRDPPTQALFPSNVDANLKRMYETPAFIRSYWRAMDEALGSRAGIARYGSAYAPLDIVAIVLSLFPKGSDDVLKLVTFVTTVITFIASIFLVLNPFDTSEATLQNAFATQWIPSFDIDYFMGVVGIGLPLWIRPRRRLCCCTE